MKLAGKPHDARGGGAHPECVSWASGPEAPPPAPPHPPIHLQAAGINWKIGSTYEPKECSLIHL
eukprot:5668202-Pyramimonas_sp.AAC.1